MAIFRWEKRQWHPTLVTSKALLQQLHLQIFAICTRVTTSSRLYPLVYSYFMAFLLWSVNCVSKLLCLNCLCHIQVPYNKTKAVEPRFQESAALILTFVLAHLLQLSTTAVHCQVFLCTCYPNVQQNSGRWRSWLCHASSSEFGYSLVIQDNRPPNDTHQIARFGSLNRGPPKNSWETFEPSAISKQSYG